jgi:hypothetical protein
MDKDFFKPILMELNIPQNKYNDVLQYIETHITHECHNKISSDNEEKFSTTLPLALKTISKLNLENVHFVKEPSFEIVSGKTAHVQTFTIPFDFSNYDLNSLIDSELEMANIFVSGTTKILNGYLAENDMYIFMLFSQIKKVNENKLQVLYRFSLKTKLKEVSLFKEIENNETGGDCKVFSSAVDNLVIRLLPRTFTTEPTYDDPDVITPINDITLYSHKNKPISIIVVENNPDNYLGNALLVGDDELNSVKILIYKSGDKYYGQYHE